MTGTLSPAQFFATLKLRELLFRTGKPVGSATLAGYLKAHHPVLCVTLGLLEQVGLIEYSRQGYTLTEEGEASVRWSAPPPPDGVTSKVWVAELTRALAEHYNVEVVDMFKVDVGGAVKARSRLCYALYSRGWLFKRIEDHFAMRTGWACRAVERWKRIRDREVPSGLELRKWRGTLVLTAAEKFMAGQREMCS